MVMCILFPSILCKYECRMGHLFVLNWARERQVALGSIVGYIEYGCACNFLRFRLTRYFFTMAACAFSGRPLARGNRNFWWDPPAEWNKIDNIIFERSFIIFCSIKHHSDTSITISTRI